MTLDQRLALARDLIARRDAIDAELAALFDGGNACPQADRASANLRRDRPPVGRLPAVRAGCQRGPGGDSLTWGYPARRAASLGRPRVRLPFDLVDRFGEGRLHLLDLGNGQRRLKPQQPIEQRFMGATINRRARALVNRFRSPIHRLEQHPAVPVDDRLVGHRRTHRPPRDPLQLRFRSHLRQQRGQPPGGSRTCV